MSELPRGWISTTLGELGTWSSGGTPSRKCAEYYGDEIPWVKTGDLKDDYLETTEECITSQGLAHSSAKLFPAGTLLLAMYGATIGKTGVLKIDAATNQACAALIGEGLTQEIIPFLWWFLIYKSEAFKAIGQGGAQPNISQTIIKRFPIKLPPLAEQRRIVAKLDSLFARTCKAREELARIPILIEHYKQAVLSAAFRGDLTADWRMENPDILVASEIVTNLLTRRKEQAKSLGKKYKEPEKAAWYPDIKLPSNWTWVSVDQLATLVQYGTSAKTSEAENEDIPVLRMGNIANGRLDFSSLKYLPSDHSEFPDLLLEKGDILFNRTNSAELVGKTAVYGGTPSKMSFASYLIRLRINGMRPELLAAYINSSYGRSWVASVVSQQVGQANVNGTKLKQLAVPLMPEQEQEEILRRLREVDRTFSTLEREVAAADKQLGHLDQASLTKAFRGELVPQNPNDEPADVLLERIRAARGAISDSPRRRFRIKAEGTLL